MHRRIALALTSAAFTAPWSLMGNAATAFPTHQVRLVIPFPAGGSTDVVGRLLAKRLSDVWGQQVLVDNRPGAGGGLGTLNVIRSEPDGQTLLLTPLGPVTVMPHVNKALGYQLADVTPVATIFNSPFMLVVSSKAPYKDFKQFRAAGRPENGAPAAYGSSGIGSASHLGGEVLNAAAGTKFVHIPYKGTPGTLQGIMTGEVQWGLALANDAKPLIQAGNLKALAVMSQQRSPLYPNLPAMAELGMKDVHLSVPVVLFVSGKTSAATVQMLNQLVRKLIEEPEFGRRMADFSAQVPTARNTPAEIMTSLRKESDANSKLVQALGVRVE